MPGVWDVVPTQPTVGVRVPGQFSNDLSWLALRAGALIGRVDEITDLTTMLTRPEAWIVTVTGSAGVGKTQLALAAAARHAAAQGVHAAVVPLSGVHEPALVSDEIVAALPGPTGLAASAAEALWERCGGDEVLLLLDNVEQIPQVGVVIRDLHEAYPSARVLVTALRPVGVQGERVLRLRPLKLPEGHLVQASDALANPAVALFVERATAADASFVLTDDNVADVVDVCRDVGGLPLAIELAAARASGIPPRLMSRQLAGASGIDLLTGPLVGAHERHVSMEAALGWTTGLLDEPTHGLLARLSVFEGPFSLDAAADVAMPSDGTVAGLVDRLSALVDFTLVDIVVPEDGTEPLGGTRFNMSSLVRGFGARMLATLGAEAQNEARARHAQYFRSRCRTGGPLKHGEWSDVVVALDRATLDGDVDDALHAAVAAAASARMSPGAAIALQPRMADLLTRSTEVADTDPATAARAMLWSAMQPDRDVSDDAAGYARWAAGRVRAALAAARESGDRHALLEALEMAVRSMPTTFEMEMAMAAIPEGLELAARLGDEASLSRFEAWTAMVARQRGDQTSAARFGTTSLRRARATGDATTVISATLILFGLPREAVEPLLDVPLDSLTELLAECERLRQPGPASYVLAVLATQAHARGDLGEAAGWLSRQLSVAAERQRTDPISTLAPIVMLVPVAAGLGRVEEAVRLRESIATMDPLIRTSIPPELFAPYEAVVEGLRRQVPLAAYEQWSRESAGMSLSQANRQALTFARAMAAAAGSAPPAPPAAPSVSVATPRGTLAEPLTQRERDVLAALASGASNKQIGASLGMSPKTVMHHSVAIYHKTGVRGRAAATAWAYRNGYVASGA